MLAPPSGRLGGAMAPLAPPCDRLCFQRSVVSSHGQLFQGREWGHNLHCSLTFLMLVISGYSVLVVGTDITNQMDN